MLKTEKSTKKERIAWYFYDWANSAFATTVIAVFLGPYLTNVAQQSAINGYLNILGIKIFADSFYHYCIFISVVLQIVFLPIIGAIADYTRYKKTLFGVFAYIGALSTMGLYFVQGGNFFLGGFLFIIANLCFGTSIVLYNSYLNDLSDNEGRDQVSSFGWAFGYLGGGLLLIVNTIFLLIYKNSIGMENAVRISICSAGVWWAIFTIIPMFGLKKREPIYKIDKQSKIVITSIKNLFQNLKNIKKYPKTLLFIIAYFFYNDGVQVVFYSSAQFGSEELGIGMDILIQVILLVQFVAFIGTFLFNKLAEIIGTKKSLLLSLVIWTGAVFYAYLFLRGQLDFFILGAVIGLVLGGTQALSRSIYSQIIPRGKEAEYFSIYELSDKGTSALGPLVFALTLQLTNSYRHAILIISLFFILGFFLLMKFDFKKAKEDVLLKI